MAKKQIKTMSIEIKNKSERVRYVRESLLKTTRKDLCKDSSISLPALRAWELSIASGLTEAGAKKLVELFKDKGVYCTEAWLLYGIGKPPIILSDSINLDIDEDRQIADEILLFRKQGNTLDALVSDDSMLPTYSPGDFVAGIIKSKKMCAEKNCIVLLSNDETLIRRFSIDEDGSEHLYCTNKENTSVKLIIKDPEIKSIAPIIWTRKKQLVDEAV